MVNNPVHNVSVDNTLLIYRHKTTDINLLGDHFPTILSSDVHIHQLNENTKKKKTDIYSSIYNFYLPYLGFQKFQHTMNQEFLQILFH